MEITEITSIIAIILSIINLGIVIKTQFYKKKPFLEIEVTKKQIRYEHERTQAQVLIDVCMIPREAYNGIKNIFFEISEEYYWGYEGNGFSKRFIKYCDNIYDKDVFKTYNYQKYHDFMVVENKDHMRDITEIESSKDVPFRFTLTEQFDGYRWPDGYDEFPSKGVSLHMFDYYGNEYIEKINFDEK